MGPDVSVIVPFHREGFLAHQTLTSIEHIRHYAEKHSISSELIILFDQTNKETEQVVKNHPAFKNKARALNVNHGDLGLSRNSGVQASSGRIVCIVDGDDLYCENWIERSVHFLTQWEPKTILHPEVLVGFGEQHYWQKFEDQTAPSFDTASLFLSNPWPSWSSAFRETYLEVPYEAALPKKTGFGFEDWHWNCNTVAAGYTHRVGPGMVGFYRRKKNSMLHDHENTGAVIAPTSLFSPETAPLFFLK